LIEENGLLTSMSWAARGALRLDAIALPVTGRGQLSSSTLHHLRRIGNRAKSVFVLNQIPASSRTACYSTFAMWVIIGHGDGTSSCAISTTEL